MTIEIAALLIFLAASIYLNRQLDRERLMNKQMLASLDRVILEMKTVRDEMRTSRALLQQVQEKVFRAIGEVH